MKNLMKHSFIYSLIIIVLLSGCGEEEDPGDAPELPPISTLVMETSDFNDTTSVNERTLAAGHWGRSAFGVGVWNVIIAVNLAIPVAAFENAFTQEPTYDFDKEVWQWTADYNIFFTKYTARLEADVDLDNSEVDWEMYVSQQNGYQDFLWYSGTSNFDRTEGEWHLNFTPDDPKAYLDVVWHRSDSSDVADIKYTSVIPDDEGNGSYISYGITEDTAYNAHYTIYDVKIDNAIQIEWNRTTKDGRVKDPAFYGDEDYRCWDESLQDVDCL